MDEIFFGFTKESTDAVYGEEDIAHTKVSFVIPCYRSARTIEGVVDEISDQFHSRLWI